MKSLLVVSASVAVLSFAASAQADTFVNGGFEGGTFSGWTQGGGSWHGGAYPDPSDPAYQNPGSTVNSITNVGFDALTNNHLATVYNGLHAAQVNNSVNDYSVSQISQTVMNYSDPTIAFAYAAVLQGSHGPTDSDAFIIQLTDLTTNTVVFQQNVNSFTASSSFTQGAYYNGNYWYYTAWTPVSVDVTVGHDYNLALLANDCPYGGHAGYAYLDGFGAVVPPPTTGTPEPSTWALMLAGCGLAGAALRRSRRQALAAA